MAISIRVLASMGDRVLIETEDGSTAVINEKAILPPSKAFNIVCDITGKFTNRQPLQLSITSVFDYDIEKNVDREGIHLDENGTEKVYRYIRNPIASNTETLLTGLGYEIGEKIINAYELCGGTKRTRAYGFLKLISRQLDNKASAPIDNEVDSIRVALGHTNMRDINFIEVSNLSCKYFKERKDTITIRVYKKCSDTRENKTYGERTFDIQEFEKLDILRLANILVDLGIGNIL